MVKKKRPNDDECDESTESCDETVKSSCPHVAKAIDLAKLKKALKMKGFEKNCLDCDKSPPQPVKSEYEEDLTLWMCLRCGKQLCGRSHNKHALSHYEMPHSDCHAITTNTTSWVVFCYNCKNEISPTSTKKLQECVEFLKKQAKSGVIVKDNSEEKITETMEPIDFGVFCTHVINTTTSNNASLKGKEKAPMVNVPRVRGLANLGNTCFFNSVMQCLVQTPYLLPVLQEMKQPGEKFVLPGGKLKLATSNNSGDSSSGEGSMEIEMSPIRGMLSSWGNLAKVLAETLEELQSPERSDVFVPRALLSELTVKHSQFGSGDQHDSHELLRHLLEAVRTEDLRRYQTVILENLGLNTKVHPAKVEGEMKQKVKFYGNQASDTMLRPEQVFRGFLVSTLECQECFHTSDREEYFLDLSLPVAADRPQPPAVVRRKGAHEDVMFGSSGGQDDKPSKHQLKKEKQAARKAAKKNKTNRGSSTSKLSGDFGSSNIADGDSSRQDNDSSSEQSDADVEDNLEENPKPASVQPQDSSTSVISLPHTAANFATFHLESGYNSEKVISSDSVRTSPVETENKEKSDLTPERTDKERMDTSAEIRSMTAIPLEYKPLCSAESISNPDSGVASPEVTKNNSSDAVNNVDSPVNDKDPGSRSSLSSEIYMDLPLSRHMGIGTDTACGISRMDFIKEGENDVSVPNINSDSLIFGPSNKEPISFNISNTINKFDHLKIKNEPLPKLYPSNFIYDSNHNNSLDDHYDRKDSSSYGYHSSTVSPRYQCDEGECSIQSCLNQFTALELMTGNNKVGCENCTKRANGENGKTVYTNATKRFLVSSPPAVLILHLKRFQIGPRCMFRKMTKHVNFPTVLDLAPFCSEKVRKRPTVKPGQTKLLYALYGVVEHSGGMHGGHYVAYVKVRPPLRRDDERWEFVPKTSNVSKGDEEPQRNGNADDDSEELSGYETGEGAVCSRPVSEDAEPPPGKWFFISDSRVQEITEDKVLRKQAYLLFYERIL